MNRRVMIKAMFFTCQRKVNLLSKLGFKGHNLSNFWLFCLSGENFQFLGKKTELPLSWSNVIISSNQFQSNFFNSLIDKFYQIKFNLFNIGIINSKFESIGNQSQPIQSISNENQTKKIHSKTTWKRAKKWF